MSTFQEAKPTLDICELLRHVDHLLTGILHVVELFPRYATLRQSDLQMSLIQLHFNGDWVIEYIRGNIAVRSLIMLSVLHRHLWSWLFSRCAFAPIFVARKRKLTYL